MLEPSYLKLHRSGELHERARQALELLRGPSCTVCPRLCKVDRLGFPVMDGIPVMLEDEARKLPPQEEVT